MSEDGIVTLQNYSLRTRESKEHLSSINLEIRKGEIVVLLGDSLSGIEYLIKSLNGIIPEIEGGIIEGDIIIDGLNTREHEVALFAPHIGILLADPTTQLVSLTVENEAAFGPANFALPTEEIIRRVDYALKACRLDGFRQRNPMTLSGGEQQSLALAALIAMRPKVIAAIDPVAMLDPIGKTRVYSVLKNLNTEYGITLIIGEHGMNIEPLCEIADRIIVMDKGKIKFDGSPSKIFENEKIGEIGIPQVTHLFSRLREYRPDLPLPVRLQEAEEYIRELAKKKGIKRVKKPAQRSKPEIKEAKKGEDPIIHVRNLHHLYPTHPPVHALKGIDLDIYPGEFVGIIGMNGGGKTTLAYHLVGLLKPTNKDSTIIVDGCDVKKSKLMEITKHINYVFQNPENQLFCETVRDELAFGPRNMGFSDNEIKKMTEEALKTFGIEQYIDEYIVNLPYDVKTYVAEAVTAAMNPNVLIIDEPTGGLDADGASKMMQSLVELNKRGKTIIIITHDMQVIAEYARHIIAMSAGTIYLNAPSREVFSKREMLNKISINPPQITMLGQNLADLGFPPDVLSVGEMFKICKSLFEGGEE